jgi:hypothetical protein
MMSSNKSIVLSFVIVMCSLCSCFKESLNEETDTTKTELAAEYLPIKKGNYWLAQLNIKSLKKNNFTAYPRYDSIYVAEDTLIKGVPHHKLLNYRYEVINGQKAYERTNIFALLKVKGDRYLYTTGAIYFTTDTIAKAIYAQEAHNNITLTSITGKAYISGTTLKWEVKTEYDKSVFNSPSNLSREDGSFYLEKNKGFTKRIIHGDLTNPNRDRVEYHVIKSQLY